MESQDNFLEKLSNRYNLQQKINSLRENLFDVDVILNFYCLNKILIFFNLGTSAFFIKKFT